MKIFKSIDDKFVELGFKKIIDNDLSVRYERENKKFEYTQVLEILHKGIVQSYDKYLFDEKKIGNCVVGLTYYEMKLALKKAKKKGWLDKPCAWLSLGNEYCDEIMETQQVIDQLTNQLKEFKEEHKIMKQILIENGLWEKLLNDDRFLKYLRDDEE